jgi:hypothetical protein
MRIKTVVAETKKDLDKVFGVRFVVFAEEGGYLSPEDYPGGRECDSFDTIDTTDNILALDDDKGVGAVRVMRKNPEVAERNGWDIGLGIEKLYNMEHFSRNMIDIAEVPRSSIIREYQNVKDGFGIPIIAMLYKQVYNTCRRNGATHICGTINLETDHPRDAQVAFSIAERKRLVTDLVAEPRIRDLPDSSDILFYPDIESPDRRYLEEVETKGVKLRLPPMLYTVAGFGCRICGPPVYYREFRRYVVPVSLNLDNVPEPTKSYFES